MSPTPEDNRWIVEQWVKAMWVTVGYLTVSKDLQEGPVRDGECRGCGHEGKVTRRWAMCDECLRYVKGQLGAS